MRSRESFKSVFAAIFLSFILFGCATAPIVEPTRGELEAARPYKTTIAIVGFSDSGSPLKGISSMAVSKLENVLAGHFNLVDRGRIKEVMADRSSEDMKDHEGMTAVGRELGAAYLLFGNVTASVSTPDQRSSESKDSEGRFHGSIWEESTAQAEISLRIVDVKSGTVIYSDRKSALMRDRYNERSFYDESSFRQALDASSSVFGQLVKVFENISSLKNDQVLLLSNTLTNAAEQFRRDIMRKFPIEGEVIQILSDRTVLINLGSAYGIRPGDKLTVWSEGSPILDPKTGMQIVEKRARLTLKVKEVTSGLSCVATASKKTIAQLNVGDKVVK
ncbi:MAG: FlgT C-terminal domain-containing protein [Candidatus Omnitrophica bacterium]|nr:FlgT C-terminal domain-containing protein [Candidatus Omnitrophota bacterium]